MTAPTPIYFRPSQVQELFGLSKKSTLYRRVKEGKIAIRKVNGCALVRTADMVELIEASVG